MQRWSRQVSCSMLSQSYSASMVVGDDGISTSWRAFDENPIFCVFSPPPWPVFEVPLQVVLKVVAACVPNGTARRGYSRMDRNCHPPSSIAAREGTQAPKVYQHFPPWAISAEMTGLAS